MEGWPLAALLFLGAPVVGNTAEGRMTQIPTSKFLEPENDAAKVLYAALTGQALPGKGHPSIKIEDKENKSTA